MMIIFITALLKHDREAQWQLAVLIEFQIEVAIAISYSPRDS